MSTLMDDRHRPWRGLGTVWRNVKSRLKRMLVRIRRTVPPGARLLLGILLMAGGLVGFLPIVGFWMLPLGIAVAALDIKPLYHWLMRNIRR